jgi:hypothetical protein
VRPRLFVEDPFHQMEQGEFLPLELHRRVLDSRINVCADIVIIDRAEKKFYLLARILKPAPWLWWIGGGVRAGQNENDAAAQIFKRETGLDLPRERFQFVEMHRMLWAERQEEPQENGRDDLAYMFALELHEDERRVAAAGLENGEYDRGRGLHGFTRPELISERVHALILETYDVIFPP